MVIHLIENGTLCNQILDNIPENPRIPMYNFLLDLTSENDKEKSIYFTGADSFITEMWNEIIQKNWRQLYVRKFIPQQFKVSCGEFYSYKNGKKRISIRNMYQLTQAWRRLCDKIIIIYTFKMPKNISTAVYFPKIILFIRMALWRWKSSVWKKSLFNKN